MPTKLNVYTVTFKSRSHPELGTRRTTVTAPTKKFVKDNWLHLCQNPDLKLVSVL